MKLVEIIPGIQTSEATKSTTLSLAAAMGKVCFSLKEAKKKEKDCNDRSMISYLFCCICGKIDIYLFICLFVYLLISKIFVYYHIYLFVFIYVTIYLLDWIRIEFLYISSHTNDP